MFLSLLLCFVMQSAAVEEAVIWEQHTVTLHRVSVNNYLIYFSMSIYFLLSACLWQRTFPFYLPAPFCPLPISVNSLKIHCLRRETLLEEQDVCSLNNSQGIQMAGNKTKEDEN